MTKNEAKLKNIKINRTFKYRVYPTQRQVEQIDFCLETCPSCGLVLDRDINAARNILKKEIPEDIWKSKPVQEDVRPVKHGQFSMTQEAQVIGGNA